jgi:hypothetical protein
MEGLPRIYIAKNYDIVQAIQKVKRALKYRIKISKIVLMLRPVFGRFLAN